MRNGQAFRGTALSWFDRRNARVELWQDGRSTAISGRPGDRPAIQLDDVAEGLAVLVYESTLSTLTYEDFGKVRHFAEQKDLSDMLERHAERGLPEDRVREAYTRFSKALVAVGDAEGFDTETGLETEFVALTNPYTDDLGAGMRVRLLYRQAPRADVQVEVFDRAPDGSVTTTRLRTDADGVATIPVAPGHAYQIDSVVLREPAADLAEAENVMWESLWANMTFAVPE